MPRNRSASGRRATRRALVALAVLVAAPAALASHPFQSFPAVRGNLDRDRALEILRIQDLGDQQSHPPRYAFRAIVDDRCRRKRVRRILSPTFATVDAYRILEADGLRGRREAFVHLGGGAGLAIIVRLRDVRGRCPVPVRIFAYPTETAAARRFTVTLGDFAPDHPGIEVNVAEISAGERRFLFYWYSRESGRYVVYRELMPGP